MTYQSQRIAYTYFLAAILLFGLQIAFGFLSLAKYLGPDPLLNVMHFATTKAIHTNLLLVWIITGFMGAAYYIVPEESRTEIYSVSLAYVQLGLWLAVGVAPSWAISLASPPGANSSKCHSSSSSASSS